MSRGLKLLRLARQIATESENSVKITGKKEERTGETEDEFLREEQDPWFYFNQWRKNQKNTPKPVENFEKKSESVELQTLNISNTGKEASPERIISECSVTNAFTYSSVSWKASNEVANDNDCTDYVSETLESEIIEIQKPLKLKQTIRSEVLNIKFGELDSTAVNSNVEFQEKNKATGNPTRNGVHSEEQNHSNDFEQPHESTQTAQIDILSNRLVRHSVETSRRKGRVWDKKDRCPYCNQDITNFSRHLFRKHSKEESVVKILEFPKGSRERKHFIDLLRKQANLLVYSENIIRPVQRPSSNPNNYFNLSDDYLPCKYCKGLYKKKSLTRHGKKCFFNRETDNNSKIRYTSEGQTILAFTESRKKFLNRLRLKTEVFDKMHADRVSFNGKKDAIICQYAEDYLRKHKRPHIKNAVSNKIRELGRLLIPLQDIYNINSMLETLKPENFDKVVASARIITRYDEATKSFQTPSLALHLRTILLAVCSAANTLLLKKDPVLPVTNYDEVLRDLRNFRELVASNWKFEMGSLAAKDLHEKHSLKPQKLPLTPDIILFKNYCHNVAGEAMKNLKKSLENTDSFKSLSEATLALTILLNRKRVGDVQYMKLESYNQSPTNANQEECLSILTEAEKELTKHFKRVMTVGKGNKPVPVLFPEKIQEYVQVMLDVRKNTTSVPKENQFLFALTGSSSKWIDGSTTLRKYAKSCGAQNPQTLTSSRLRKQIATVLQILNLNEIEMEQIATFMGHTKKTHEEFYRLPQEVYQTSKIAKLLLMMQKGITKEDEGKTLDEIDIELKTWEKSEPTSKAHGETEEDQIIIEPDNEEDVSKPVENSSLLLTNNKPRQLKKPQAKSRCRGSWTIEHKNIMLNFFKKHVKNKIAPKKAECLQLIQKHMELFGDKNWVQIKVFVYNTYNKK